jgi:hypothetical protein
MVKFLNALLYEMCKTCCHSNEACVGPSSHLLAWHDRPMRSLASRFRKHVYRHMRGLSGRVISTRRRVRDSPGYKILPQNKLQQPPTTSLTMNHSANGSTWYRYNLLHSCQHNTQQVELLSGMILSRVLVTTDGVWHNKSSQSTFTSLYVVTARHSGYSSAVSSLDVSW